MLNNTTVSQWGGSQAPHAADCRHCSSVLCHVTDHCTPTKVKSWLFEDWSVTGELVVVIVMKWRGREAGQISYPDKVCDENFGELLSSWRSSLVVKHHPVIQSKSNFTIYSDNKNLSICKYLQICFSKGTTNSRLERNEKSESSKNW